MKKIVVIISVLIVLFAGGVLAANISEIGNFDNTDSNFDETIVVDETVNANEEIVDVVYEVDNVLTSYLKSCGDRYAVTGELERAYRMIADFSPASSHLTYLTELIKEGCEASWVMELYSFWTTCDEDIGIIKTMYDLSESENLIGRYWIEDAFNEATSYSHGVLSAVEISTYMNDGVALEDIGKANLLSRRKGYTIHGIIDRILAGETIEEIEAEIPESNETMSMSSASVLTSEKAEMQVYELSAEIEEKIDDNSRSISSEIKTMIGEDRYKALSEYPEIYIYNACKYAEKISKTAEEILEENRGTGKYSKILEKAVYIG